MGITFGEKITDSESFIINSDSIQLVDGVRHLGNYVITQLSDCTDCSIKLSVFIGSVNKLLGQFFHLELFNIGHLFSFCCYSFMVPVYGI